MSENVCNEPFIERITTHAMNVRHVLEEAWTPQTSAQRLAEVPYYSQSRGQGGASSLYFCQYLRGLLYENVVLCDGEVPIMPGVHIWCEVQHPNGDIIVADITADQYKGYFCAPKKKIYVGPRQTERRGVYMPKRQRKPAAALRGGLPRRYNGLVQKVNALPNDKKQALVRPLPITRLTT